MSTEPILQAWTPDRREPVRPSSSDLLDPAALAQMAVAGETFYEPAFLWGALPDGSVAYSDSSAYVIRVATSNGEIVRTLRRSFTPESVTDRIRGGTREAWLESMTDMNLPPEMTQAIEGFDEMLRDAVKTIAMYHEVPVVRRLEATWTGTLWVQRRGEDPWDDEGPIDVFDADHHYVGTLPPGITRMPVAFGPDGLVAFWDVGDLDVPVVVVKRLPAELR